MEIFAHVLLSVIGSALIAAIATPLLHVFGQDAEFLMMWLVCFLAWWGIVLIGEC